MRLLVYVVFATTLGILQMANNVKGAEEGQYSVVGPGTIHSARDYNVAVAVHHTKQPVKLKIGITGPSHNETQTVELSTPNEPKQLTFKLPKLAEGDYNLTAEGIEGLKFHNTTKLNLSIFKPYIRIQTDKGKYKPGDVINYRVLFLDENLKPAQPEENAAIYIEDNKRNRIYELKHFETTTGVYTGKFELSDFATLGSWSLKVENSGSYYDEGVYFEVEKYVLPKYTVKIESTEKLSVRDGDMQVIVRANYTYGKPVAGKVLLLLNLDGTTIWTTSNGESVEEKKPPYSTIYTADMVNGKAKFDLNLKEYAPFLPYETHASYIRITATVEEDFTGVKINETSGTLLYPYRYAMDCSDYNVCYEFHGGKEQDVSFKITLVDGTVIKDTKSVVRAKYTEGLRHTNWYPKGEEPSVPEIENKTFVFESHLNDSGIVTFKIKLDDLPDITNFSRYYELQLEFIDEKRNILTTYPHREPEKPTSRAKEEETEFFKIVAERAPDVYAFNLGDDVKLSFNSSKPLNYFVYNIIGRGNVLETKRIEFKEPTLIHNETLKTTFLMAPYARIYAYYVDDKGEFRFAEINVPVKVELQNQISINAVDEVKPGTNVTLEINTQPQSFVGLLAVDQSVLLLGNNNDLSTSDFNWRLGGFDTRTPWQGGYSYYPGESSGVVTMTNGRFFYNRTKPYYYSVGFSTTAETHRKMGVAGPIAHDSASMGGGAAVYASVAVAHNGQISGDIAVRKNFVETWIFDDIESTVSEVTKWTKTIPDTITSWVLSAFAVHPEKGLGVTKEKKHIKTFQPFFISIRLPYSVKRGEVINVPALVFNYLPKNLDVEITLDNLDDEYEFLDASNEVISETKRVQTVRVNANEAAGVSFLIRPKIIGNILLKFLAVSPIAGDAIHKTLKVVPEGVTQYANRAFFVNLKDTPEQQESFALELPTDYVPDSQHVEFAVVGDLLGPVIKNMEKLIRLPSGCGEQTMSALVPNYLVYNYLKSINKLTPNMETRIKRNLESGYQNILNYRHDDGSFSSFGPHNWDPDAKPRNGSTWLTAYVLRSLQKMAEHVKIDDNIFDKGYTYLLSRQAKNGSFTEQGEYFYSSQRSLLSLTSNVLLTLSARKAPADEQTDLAVKYLEENIENSEEDLLPKAIATYTLQKLRGAEASKHVSNLKALSKTEDGRTWWSKSDNSYKINAKRGICARWGCPIYSNDVELTSYALLTLIENETPKDVLPIIKWLVAQRNNYGGFGSSQDTVVGLQALIKFAERAGYEAAVAEVDVTSHGGREKRETIKVTEENGLLLQTLELPQGTTDIDFHAKGTGAALVQISYQYNIVEKEPKPSFKIESILKKDVPLLKLELDVCVQYVEEQSQASNMAILEVSLPSGYTADDTSFAHIRKIERVRRVETKNGDSVVVIYFESLPKDETKCIPIEAYKTFEVSQQKPAPIVLYDYYDTNKKATDYYQIDSKLFDECQDAECKKSS